MPSSSSSYTYSSSRSRSPVPRRGRSPSSSSSSSSPPRRAPRRGPTDEPQKAVLHVKNLTRNVNEEHLREIFGNYGSIKNVELAVDALVKLPKGYAFIEFASVDLAKAAVHPNSYLRQSAARWKSWKPRISGPNPKFASHIKRLSKCSTPT